MASNVIGIKIESNERYDRLMNEFSKPGYICGINFKELFQGYPDGYPCLVEYYVGDKDPFGFMYAPQLREILNAGYLIQVYKEKESITE